MNVAFNLIAGKSENEPNVYWTRVDADVSADKITALGLAGKMEFLIAGDKFCFHRTEEPPAVSWDGDVITIELRPTDQAIPAYLIKLKSCLSSDGRWTNRPTR